jgi:uroporphyrinogen decarboxylase
MKPLLAVLKGEKPSRRPVWFMRQAGRYLPEYRAIRDKKGGFLDLCYDPDAAGEVTLQPLRRYDLDAAIVFADILVLPHAMGVDVDFAAGEGPVVGRVADERAVSQLRESGGSWQVSAVCETLQRVKKELGAGVALIGFCGAPWTVASYMIEGGSSEERLLARRAAAERPKWFETLIGRLVEESVDYLVAQVRAGAEVVQVFDSWAGDLPWDMQEEWVQMPVAALVSEFRKRCPGVPVIVFARGAGAGHAGVVERVRPEGVGIESGVPVDWARDNFCDRVAVQGNLDPVVLAGGGSALERSVTQIVERLPAARHIFNLGHGVRQETDPERLAEVVTMVRRADG